MKFYNLLKGGRMEVMNILEELDKSALPLDMRHSALLSLNDAAIRAEGLNVDKWKVRLFKADKISKLLEWEDERLCIRYPEYADWDIAPMINITAYGDKVPWAMTPEGGRPMANMGLTKDPNDPEYQALVERARYWADGVHPRSRKGHKIWYRRNGGEYMAWDRGVELDTRNKFEMWENERNVVMNQGAAWFIETKKHMGCDIYMRRRLGFEVGNVYNPKNKEQAWYPIEGYALKAPVTSSITFKRIKPKK